MDSENLGDLGEDSFKAMCSKAGLNLTKPSKDENGWDAYIEFPWPKENHISLDKQEAPVRCKIQVKATHTMAQHKLSIKLSAMHKLAVEYMPTFVCFMHFKKSSSSISPKEMYLVHLDQEIIGKILKRVRQSEINKKPLNHQTIDISYSEYHKLKKATGPNLKEEILKYINGSNEKYIQDKQKMLKSLGYDEAPYEMKLKISAQKREDLIQNYLINQEGMDVKITSIMEKRFNIPLPAKDVLPSLGTVKMYMKQPEQKFKLHIRKHKFEKAIILDVNFRTHPLIQGVFFLYNEIIELPLDYSNLSRGSTCNMTIFHDKEYEFKVISQHMKFFKLIEDNINGELEFEIFSENNMATSLKLYFNINKKLNIQQEVYDAFLLYEKLFAHLQIDTSSLVSINFMMSLINQASNFYSFLSSDESQSLFFTSTLESSTRRKVNDFILIIPVYFTFNDTAYILIAEATTDLEIKEDNTAIGTGKSHRILNQLEIKKDEFNKNEILELISDKIQGLNYKNYCVLFDSNSTFIFED
ncbi:hypothetical protein [Aliarcobacter butzleri]|uniref:hypothetical protein n=1 Tax=Aliarcobacter butzleri TaxID=28197 RepID=UPI00263EFAA3|nr:hypothetical protein [Aliarcobacter butzleri]MDN5060005.1 hypothetical protein [Aliarcobacter butzleri]